MKYVLILTLLALTGTVTATVRISKTEEIPVKGLASKQLNPAPIFLLPNIVQQLQTFTTKIPFVFENWGQVITTRPTAQLIQAVVGQAVTTSSTPRPTTRLVQAISGQAVTTRPTIQSLQSANQASATLSSGPQTLVQAVAPSLLDAVRLGIKFVLKQSSPSLASTFDALIDLLFITILNLLLQSF